MNQSITEKVLSANSICFLTGAGVSAESGIPTFRDAKTGYWEQFNPQELATQEAFTKDPQLVWNWYQWRRQLVADAKPNSAHKVITKIQQQLPNVNVITQNVDGLHQASGSREVIEFHGNIRNNKCNICKYAEVNMDNLTEDIPECPHCKTLLRPAVVWFGEAIPARASAHSIKAVKECDVFFSVGTSSQVHPAAGLAQLARINKAMIIEINPNATPLSSSADYAIAEPAGSALEDLAADLFK